jgi:hypothetical protein
MYRLKMLRDRVVQNADRLIRSPELQKAATWAAETASRVKANLVEARKVFLEQLKNQLDELEKSQNRSVDHKGNIEPT